MVAFPAMKLGALAIKQISKPIAKAIRVRAVRSPLLRRIVMVPAQGQYVGPRFLPPIM